MEISKEEINILPTNMNDAISFKKWAFIMSQKRNEEELPLIGVNDIHRVLTETLTNNPNLKIIKDNQPWLVWRNEEEPSKNNDIFKEDIFKLKISIHNLQQKMKRLESHDKNHLKFSQMHDEYLNTIDKSVLGNKRRLTEICEILNIPFLTDKELSEKYD